jgi:hypothetical protein
MPALPPRRELTDTETLPCPWCLDDQSDDQDPEGHEFVCTNCHKPFVLGVEKDGGLFAVGVLSKTDKKYLAWLEQRAGA